MVTTIGLRWQPFFHAQESNLYAYLIAFLFCALLASTVLTSQRRETSRPPSLWDPIPFVFNTAQFLTNNHKFMTRVAYVSCFVAFRYYSLLLRGLFLTYLTQKNTRKCKSRQVPLGHNARVPRLWTAKHSSHL